jgi:predicted AAA+ superfamily ATPase
MMQYYKRRIFNELNQQLSYKEIVVLTGMRRTGKTTLLKMLFEKVDSENKLMLDMENLINQKVFSEIDFNNVWNGLKEMGLSPDKKAWLFLDEIQAMPEIVNVIKFLYDHYDVKFILTGSSSFYLKNLFPESLSGRKIMYELFPLDFEEFLIFKGKEREFSEDFQIKNTSKSEIRYEKTKNDFEEFLHFGGFPGIVLTEDETRKKALLSDIFTSYYEKDIRQMADFKNMAAFRNLMMLLMQRVGSLLDITKLASEADISRDSVYTYLSFLEGTYFISLVRPYSKNVNREVSGRRKVFLCDNGFLNLFSKVSQGSLLENAMFNSLRKYGDIRYYQRHSGVEIDFILAEKSLALEVKNTGTSHDLRKLEKLSADIGMNDHFLITYNYANLDGAIPASMV